MKKVLFATSALVAFAGAAAAEVVVTGDARMGMRYDSDLCSREGVVDGEIVCTATDSAWNVVNRARVKFTMTGQTDSGLEFGASFRADQASRARLTSNNRLSADTGKVWISGTYGKLTAGDIDSAMENALGDLPEIGVSELDNLNEFAYSSSEFDQSVYGEAGLLYEYSINGVKLYASFMDQKAGFTAVDRDNNAYSLGVGYEMAGYEFGLGFEKADLYYDVIAGGVLRDNENKSWGLSVAGAFNEVKVKGIYMSTKLDGNAAGGVNDALTDTDIQQYGIGAEYMMANGVGLAGYYRHVKYDPDGLDTVKADVIGLGASYDLGGGATLKGGIAHVNADDEFADTDFADRTLADFGVTFKF